MKKRALKLYFTTMKSPIGKLYLGATDKGICKLTWRKASWNNFPNELSGMYEVEAINDNNHFDVIIDELKKYFSGKLKHFSIEPDLLCKTEFEKRILLSVKRIEWGETRSYGNIAEQSGCPGGARAAGNAIGKNPVPIVIPCHRVIKSDGALGGFTGGLDIKEFLLRTEGIDRY